MTDVSEQPRVDVWGNFYDKVNDIYTFHEKYNSGALIDEQESALDAEAMFTRIMDEVIDFCDKRFTAEEGNGRYLDMHALYL
jgi:hypothetical protein